ncbi:MAG TPA: type II toxin-antitoxin system HicA family toxin [Methylomirabilota bacterium]|nr:type II toxin-antitoxin system HicA family toxin [Methylomirabilota bacterium]
MSRLPVCSGADAAKAFRKLGYEVDHQTGSHTILRHSAGPPGAPEIPAGDQPT